MKNSEEYIKFLETVLTDLIEPFVAGKVTVCPNDLNNADVLLDKFYSNLELAIGLTKWNKN